MKNILIGLLYSLLIIACSMPAAIGQNLFNCGGCPDSDVKISCDSCSLMTLKFAGDNNFYTLPFDAGYTINVPKQLVTLHSGDQSFPIRWENIVEPAGLNSLAAVDAFFRSCISCGEISTPLPVTIDSLAVTIDGLPLEISSNVLDSILAAIQYDNETVDSIWLLNPNDSIFIANDSIMIAGLDSLIAAVADTSIVSVEGFSFTTCASDLQICQHSTNTFFPTRRWLCSLTYIDAATGGIVAVPAPPGIVAFQTDSNVESYLNSLGLGTWTVDYLDDKTSRYTVVSEHSNFVVTSSALPGCAGFQHVHTLTEVAGSCSALETTALLVDLCSNEFEIANIDSLAAAISTAIAAELSVLDSMLLELQRDDTVTIAQDTLLVSIVDTIRATIDSLSFVRCGDITTVCDHTTLTARPTRQWLCRLEYLDGATGDLVLIENPGNIICYQTGSGLEAWLNSLGLGDFTVTYASETSFILEANSQHSGFNVVSSSLQNCFGSSGSVKTSIVDGSCIDNGSTALLVDLCEPVEVTDFDSLLALVQQSIDNVDTFYLQNDTIAVKIDSMTFINCSGIEPGCLYESDDIAAFQYACSVQYVDENNVPVSITFPSGTLAADQNAVESFLNASGLGEFNYEVVGTAPLTVKLSVFSEERFLVYTTTPDNNCLGGGISSPLQLVAGSCIDASQQHFALLTELCSPVQVEGFDSLLALQNQILESLDTISIEQPLDIALMQDTLITERQDIEQITSLLGCYEYLGDTLYGREIITRINDGEAVHSYYFENNFVAFGQLTPVPCKMEKGCELVTVDYDGYYCDSLGNEYKKWMTYCEGDTSTKTVYLTNVLTNEIQLFGYAETTESCPNNFSIAATTEDCIITIRAENPNDGSFTAAFELVDDNISSNGIIDCIVENSCDGSTYRQQLVVPGAISSHSYSNRNNPVEPFETGGYATTIRLAQSAVAPGIFDVNLDPYSSPYLSGCSGTVTAADLLFDGSSNTTAAAYVAALTIQIENALCALSGAAAGVNYQLSVSCSTGGALNISFRNKHNPAANWIGIDRVDTFFAYNIDGNTPSSKDTKGGSFGQPNYTCINSDFCEVIGMMYNTAHPFINSQTNFNFFTLADSRPLQPFEGSYPSGAVCEQEMLTAETDCPGTATYLWSTGETTASIFWDGTGVQPTVEVFCECIDISISPCCNDCETVQEQPVLLDKFCYVAMRPTGEMDYYSVYLDSNCDTIKVLDVENMPVDSLPGNAAIVNCEELIKTPCTVNYSVEVSTEDCLFSVDANTADGTGLITITAIPDSIYGTATDVVCTYTNSCTGEVIQELNQGYESRIETTTSVSTNVSDGTDEPLSTGGYMQSVLLSQTQGAAFTVNLDPATTPYLSGCAGTVAANDLIFGNVSATALANNIEVVISNAICVLSPGNTTPENYMIDVTVSSNGFARIRTQVKHQPTDNWIGIDRNNTSLQYFDGVANIEHIGVGVTFPVWTPRCRYTTSCATQIEYRGEGISLLDVSQTGSINYNNLVTAPPQQLTLNADASNLTEVCQVPVLRLVHDCNGSVDYLWSTGETTATIQWDGTGMQPTGMVTCYCEDEPLTIETDSINSMMGYRCHGAVTSNQEYYENDDNTTDVSFSNNATSMKWAHTVNGPAQAVTDFIAACIDAGDEVFIELEYYVSGGTAFTSFTGTGYSGSPATGIFITGYGGVGVNGKLHSVKATCGAVGGQGLAYFCGNCAAGGQWLDTETNEPVAVADTYECTPPVECDEIFDVTNIVCLAEDVPGVGVVGDYVISMSTFDCERNLLSSGYFTYPDAATEVAAGFDVDLECPVPTIRDRCIIDGAGIQWTEVFFLDDNGVEVPDSRYYYNQQLVTGTPFGEPATWTACLPKVAPQVLKTCCAMIDGIQYQGSELVYYDEVNDEVITVFQPFNTSNSYDQYFAFDCNSCMQYSQCFSGRNAFAHYAITATGDTIAAQNLVDDGRVYSAADLAATIELLYGGLISTSSGAEDVICSNVADLDAFVMTDVGVTITAVGISFGSPLNAVTDYTVSSFGSCGNECKTCVNSYICDDICIQAIIPEITVKPVITEVKSITKGRLARSKEAVEETSVKLGEIKYAKIRCTEDCDGQLVRQEVVMGGGVIGTLDSLPGFKIISCPLPQESLPVYEGTGLLQCFTDAAGNYIYCETKVNTVDADDVIKVYYDADQLTPLTNVVESELTACPAGTITNTTTSYWATTANSLLNTCKAAEIKCVNNVPLGTSVCDTTLNGVAYSGITIDFTTAEWSATPVACPKEIAQVTEHCTYGGQDVFLIWNADGTLSGRLKSTPAILFDIEFGDSLLDCCQFGCEGGAGFIARGNVNGDGTTTLLEGATVFRNGVGLYTVVFDTPRATADYNVQATAVLSPGRDSYAVYPHNFTTDFFQAEVNEGDNGTAANIRRDGAWHFLVTPE